MLLKDAEMFLHVMFIAVIVSLFAGYDFGQYPIMSGFCAECGIICGIFGCSD